MPSFDARISRNAHEQRPSGRSFLIDAIKATGCLLIVLHHLAFYGPMSDVVAKAWPALVAWFYDYGRLAVQLFLVCSGFLTAGSLARLASLSLPQALTLLGQRYLRLAIPLWAALSFTVLVSEWVRPYFEHASLSATPDAAQALAHLLLLQHVLAFEALSAGIWYVAIDFQLYAMALFSLVLATACRSAWRLSSIQVLRMGLWLGLTCASWWWWNLDTHLDAYGLYFFGAYGLGLLAWEVRCHGALNVPQVFCKPHHRQWAVWGTLLVLAGVAWALGPRWRMAVAFGVVAVLMVVPRPWLEGGTVRVGLVRRVVSWLSVVSYSVFLIHFGVSLAVNAVVTWVWPKDLASNALGILVSLMLSLALGGLLHRFVERHTPSWRRWWAWVGVFKVSVLVAWWMNPTV